MAIVMFNFISGSDLVQTTPHKGRPGEPLPGCVGCLFPPKRGSILRDCAPSSSQSEVAHP